MRMAVHEATDMSSQEWIGEDDRSVEVNDRCRVAEEVNS
jgi:hypothetical protein